MTGQQSDHLPLPDYDQLPAGSVEHRIRPLASRDVRQLLEYERTHADRPQVIDILSVRLRQLEEGAQPSSGDPEGTQPDRPEPSRGGSPVSTASSPEPSPPFRHGERDVQHGT